MKKGAELLFIFIVLKSVKKCQGNVKLVIKAGIFTGSCKYGI